MFSCFDIYLHNYDQLLSFPSLPRFTSVTLKASFQSPTQHNSCLNSSLPTPVSGASSILASVLSFVIFTVTISICLSVWPICAFFLCSEIERFWPDVLWSSITLFDGGSLLTH
ncbi:unnamed protein product [Calicophoron daubneyi]|uniref:Uncharacterized protein n=1 Tax=Calicophoron daubneyi TaxID=300641 RepID=A0AAV2TDZ6_CALDB